jgi:4,5-dihydroxyphthalate decarboxylase
MLGHDLWPIGVAKNRANLERFMEYSRDQGLIDKPMPVDSLFADNVLVS